MSKRAFNAATRQLQYQIQASSSTTYAAAGPSSLTASSSKCQISRQRTLPRCCSSTSNTIPSRRDLSSYSRRRAQNGAPTTSANGTYIPVSEELLMQYAESPPAYVTLKDLMQHGRPPLSESALIASAEATRKELPHRLARRVLAHRSLPFIVGRNPYIAQVYNLYETSFSILSDVPEIKSLEDNEAFSATLDQLVADHADNVPILAKGFSECKDYLSEDEISTFFDRAVRNRIGIRLIAEQHLALTFHSKSAGDVRSGSRPSSTEVGIVDTRCSLARIVRECGYHVESLCDGAYGRSPDLKVTGDVHALFAYIPSHIDYVLNELLKNAFRATCERYSSSPNSDVPPVFVNIAKAPSSPLITLRIRDSGGGIPPEILPRVNSYAFTTVSPASASNEGNEADGVVEEDMGPYSIQNVGAGPPSELGGVQSGTGHLAGLGFGLPLSKLHCEYFGGSLELVSLYGHGTDAFVVLRGEEAT